MTSDIGHLSEEAIKAELAETWANHVTAAATERLARLESTAAAANAARAIQVALAWGMTANEVAEVLGVRRSALTIVGHMEPRNRRGNRGEWAGELDERPLRSTRNWRAKATRWFQWLGLGLSVVVFVPGPFVGRFVVWFCGAAVLSALWLRERVWMRRSWLVTAGVLLTATSAICFHIEYHFNVDVPYWVNP